MPVIAAGDIYEVKFGTYYGGQAGINVSHWRCDSVMGASASSANFGVRLDNIFAPLYKAVMGGQATWYGVRLQRIKPVPVTVAEVVAINIGVGTFSANVLPSVVSGVVKLPTELTGRRERGRQFIAFPGTTAHDSTLNRPTAAYVTALQTLANAYTPIVAGAMGDTANMVPGIYHRFAGTVTTITLGVAQAKWASVHKRGNFGQGNVYPPF